MLKTDTNRFISRTIYKIVRLVKKLIEVALSVKY